MRFKEAFNNMNDDQVMVITDTDGDELFIDQNHNRVVELFDEEFIIFRLDGKEIPIPARNFVSYKVMSKMELVMQKIVELGE